MDFVTVSTGLILPYWMGLPIRYIHLQNLLQIKIDFNTSIGLMIHISCMIERLVTHSSIYEEVDISSFAKKEIDTIHIIKESLKDIELNYGISIPTYELLYIYDYIKSFLH